MLYLTVKKGDLVVYERVKFDLIEQLQSVPLIFDIHTFPVHVLLLKLQINC